MKLNSKYLTLKASAIIAALFFLHSCAIDNGSSDFPSDYSKASNWLSIPVAVKPVDVFYLYPTAWTNDDVNPVISTIYDSTMIIKASEAFSRQASAFETQFNVYAPFYRQDNNSPIDRLKTIAGSPTVDASAAFDYYIQHFNNGRPFILAGHSQGASVLMNILAGYLKKYPKVYARMVAAYVIGAPVTRKYLNENPHLKFATGPDDTGVIISYNSEAPIVAGTNPVLYGTIGLVINPITWTRDETLATEDQGLGSFMPVQPSNTFMRVPQCTDARVDTTRGVLICNTMYKDFITKINKAEGFPAGVYHSFDFPFFYYNIRENAANRANKFLEK